MTVLVKLSGNTNDTAAVSSSSVTSFLGISAGSQSFVICAAMDYKCAPENAGMSGQFDPHILNGSFGYTSGISLDVTQVTNVSFFRS
jgi:hypothetical protein